MSAASDVIADVTTAPLKLDEHQQRVVDRVAGAGHGPLLVLAGPGTGKTTTLVEAIAARVVAGTSPEQILTLTFSRRAAAELRSRIARRLQRTVAAPLAWTFHGFGYSLVGEQLAPDDLGRALRLLSGPEQEVVVRDLLAYDLELGSVAWPAELDAALKTRGFTEQVRTFMGTARSLGLAPEQIKGLNPERPDWAALGTFMTEYLDVIDSQGLLDYSELVSRAVAYAESPEGQKLLRDRYRLVVVDEYQDTDHAQERLLKAIAGDGRDLVAVGDPDQSIYAFRGAEVRGITEFVDRFRDTSNRPAQILKLRTSRRCSVEVIDKSRHVAALLGSAGSIPAVDLKEHRALDVPADQIRGSVEIRFFPTAEREAAAIAELLRREHLHGRTPWSQMAVLVRSGTTSIPGVQRALTISGVPVEVAVDELPLRDHPAVAPLLTVLEYAARPASLTPERVHDLLLSPLVGASASDIRRLGRVLRSRERDRGVRDPKPSSTMICSAVLDPERLEGVASATAAPAQRLGEIVAELHRQAQDGRSAHECLWSLWDGSTWSRRLMREANGSGPAAAAANRALDAVVSLFDMAARSRDRSTRADLRTFFAEVAAQDIPAGTLDDAGVSGHGVRVMTAHRSKGLEWDVVVVAGVQADVWPDLRRRGSVIDADLLGSDGLRVPSTVADLRREERRLFYVAITRARRRLVCTAVQAPAEDGARPSPFLQDLDVEPVPEVEVIRHPLTLPGVVAGLRRGLSDRKASPAFRAAAAARLGALARHADDGNPSVPGADPEHWWGLRDPTGAVTPAFSEDQPLQLHLSGSQIETLNRCPLQWYLSRRVKAESSRGAAAGFGGILHALADAVAREELPAEVDALTRALDDIWSQLPYPAAWEASQEHDAAVAAIKRFLEWNARARDRELVATEIQFDDTFTIFDVVVHLSGRVDRLERDSDGLVVVDFKTSRAQRASKDVESDLQLATYRRLVAAEFDLPTSSVGAELVQLRVPESKNASGPKVQEHDPSDETDQALQQALERAVTLISTGQFPAIPNKTCSYCQFSLTCPAQPAGREVIS
jgi:superfamily I DNA/RNA helicase/RecB family exonuclease